MEKVGNFVMTVSYIIRLNYTHIQIHTPKHSFTSSWFSISLW